jgi:membrane protease YdiL (CAAX protease family)
MILRLSNFTFSELNAEGLIEKARTHKALILDLRGNPGGSLETLKHFLAGFFEHDVKIGDEVKRDKTTNCATKTRHDPFTGKLFVLIDSQSASAAEIFARVIQLEKRGMVIGDVSSGSVMAAQFRWHTYGHSSGACSISGGHPDNTAGWLLRYRFRGIVANLFVATLAVLFSCLSAAGEEIGWRGFLVPELMKFNSFTRTALISGVVWSAWHLPLILWSGYNSGTPSWYAVSCFAVMVISISFVFAWLRLKSGSVWPAVLLHASHNAIIQIYLDGLTVSRGPTNYLIGEFGCAMSPLTIFFAWIVWRRRAEVERGNASPAAA